jgi:pimeloyl-ACP methyl ester carboxylesterase
MTAVLRLIMGTLRELPRPLAVRQIDGASKTTFTIAATAIKRPSRQDQAMPCAVSASREIFYEDSGGEGPAIVFSHGLLMDRTMFAPQVAALRGAYRCIVWDERGHGRTASETIEPFDYDQSAEDCAAVLRHAGVERAVLAGMSQGGFLSLRCALRHPALVRALILIDSQAGLEDPAKMPGYEAMLAGWAANGLSDQSAAVIAHIILGEGFPAAEAWKARWRAMAPHNVLASFQALVTRDDVTEVIAAIGCPALVIHGDADAAIPVERAEAMRARLPGARPMVVVKGAGHAANLSHPSEVNAAIETFLASLPA